MATLLGAALYYAEQGIPVFPVRPRDKRPAVEHGFKDATTDPAVITAWWTRNPEYNIGAPTGIKFDVIDLDGPTARESIAPFIDTLPIMGRAKTARDDGGEHLFVPVTGLGNKTSKVGKFYPGIDYRGDGGYAVLAPSIGETGRAYEWLERPVFGKAADLAHPFYSVFTPSNSSSLIGVDLASIVPLVDYAAEQELAAACWEMFTAEEGGRNHLLNTLAYRVGRLVGAGRLLVADATAALERAGIAAGLTEHETGLTVASGLTAGAAEPRPAPGHEDDDAPSGPTPVDWVELWQQPDQEEWIAEPILPARRLVALYSAPKVGKSILLLEIAVAISKGTEVFGVRPDRPRRVLYIDSENDMRGDVRKRLEAMGYGPADLPELKYFSFEALGEQDTKAGGAKVVALVEEYAAEVVIIDTVSRHIDGDENDNNTWLNWYKHTGKHLKRMGVGVVRLDHEGKDGSKGQRGGSAKSGDVDMIWRMRISPKSRDVVQLHLEASRIRTDTELLTLVRRDGPLRHEVDNAVTELIPDAVDEKVIALEKEGLDPSDCTTRSLSTFLRGAGYGYSDSQRSEIITRYQARREAEAAREDA